MHTIIIPVMHVIKFVVKITIVRFIILVVMDFMEMDIVSHANKIKWKIQSLQKNKYKL